MDNENIEKIWAEMLKNFEWMKATLESLPAEELIVLENRLTTWFADNPLEL